MRSVICRVLVVLFTFSCQISIFAQLKKLKEANLFTEREIFIDQKTNLYYSDLIRVKFSDKITNNCRNSNIIELEDIANLDIRDILKEIESIYGPYTITRISNFKILENSVVKNKRTGNMVKIPDWSNVYRIIFNTPIPLNTVIDKLNSSIYVDYAEGPLRAYQTISPNDEKYLNDDNWAFKAIQAEDAWDLTTGDSTIIIGIHDKFGDTNVTKLHEDLIGRVDGHFNNFGGHGICVSGVAGANTNNKIGVASLGWNLRLKLYDFTYPIVAILNAINDGVDILNFSHVTRANLKVISDAIKTALAAGIICVASAGNNQYPVPDTLFPAAYNFGELGQVIAVSGTMLTDSVEEFIEDFNYSPGCDPIKDPTASFVDVAAPGMDITVLSNTSCSNYIKACGTSLAAPFVSALIGLMLSIDKNLSAKDIYEILTKTTDKVGKNSYDESGWNKYLGYGRINAHKAMLEVQRRFLVSAKNDQVVNTNISLQQNYPNPFNPSTTIKYSIPKQSNVTLKVYDVLGSEVATLVNKEQPQGNYEVEFDNIEISSGIYFYRLRAGDFVDTKKMILLK